MDPVKFVSCVFPSSSALSCSPYLKHVYGGKLMPSVKSTVCIGNSLAIGFVTYMQVFYKICPHEVSLLFK
jgi:hypothetical protein